MYVEVLSGALSGWVVDLTDDALLHYVLACRATLPRHELGAAGAAHESLVAEVRYDRALMSLAAAKGIDVSPHNFCHPQIERCRLEAALARLGIDLDALSREPPPDPDPPPSTAQP
jgi:hypothetical protein